MRREVSVVPRWWQACLSRCIAPVLKEVAEQFGGFGLEQTFLDRHGVVEAAICGRVMEGTRVTGLRVGGGVDEAVDAGGVGGSGAHRAGFQSGVEGAPGEAPASYICGGATNGEEFGVGCRVSRGLAGVGCDGEDPSPSRDHRPHRDLALLGCAFGGLQGTTHHGDVCGALIFGSTVHRADNSRGWRRGASASSSPR